MWGFGTADARLAVGTDGQCLVADSTSAVGLKWGACGSGGALDSAVVHNTGTETVGGDKTFSGNITVQGTMTVAGSWQVESAGPATAMTVGAGDSKVGFDADGKLKVSENGDVVTEVAKVSQIPAAGLTVPLMDGTAVAGSAAAYAPADHVHPTDTSRAKAQSCTNKLLKAVDAGAAAGTIAAVTAAMVDTMLAAFGAGEWKLCEGDERAKRSGLRRVSRTVFDSVDHGTERRREYGGTAEYGEQGGYLRRGVEFPSGYDAGDL